MSKPENVEVTSGTHFPPNDYICTERKAGTVK
jgi:hypothetical protein